jgi:Arc/MetJ-type ribon-helix-helix transcriptional regulator
MSITSYFMKHKISLSLELDTIMKINDSLRGKKFRNKSHVVEFALDKLFREEIGK